MREKAREFFLEARTLFAAGKPNGAASRLYYSLYHAVIAEFEKKGIKQSSLTNKVDPNKPTYWLHETVRNFSNLAGLTQREAGMVRHAWECRAIADYEVKSVDSRLLVGMLRDAEGILESLGVDV